jgi:nitroreductase
MAKSSKYSRRTFLQSIGAGSLLLVGGHGLGGCNSYYSPEAGIAFAPWNYPPEGETRPEWLAAAAAVLAASPHNTQPWLFAIRASHIDLYVEPARNLGTMDGLRRELHIGLGCALENLVLAAARHGRSTTVKLLPDPSDETHVAAIDLIPAAPTGSELYDAIARRHTNRTQYLESEPPAGLEQAIRTVCTEPGVHLTWLASAQSKQRFADATLAATQAIVDDEQMNADSDAWYRHTAAEIEQFRDGPTIDAAGLPAAQRNLGKLLSRPDARAAGTYWIDSTRARQLTGFAFVVLSTPHDAGREAQLSVGRAYQRTHLWATAHGLAMQPLNQLAERADREEILGLPSVARAAIAELLGERTGERAQMLFRIGVPWEDGLRSPRRPLDWAVRS